MHSKITSAHTERLACVYVRQSTLHQVRNHVESRRRQEALSGRAEQLGWPPSKVRLITEDLGLSASSAQSRSGYQRLAQMVHGREVGLLLAIEVSRLARDDLNWQRMVRACLFNDVLLGDDQHVYDPNDPHDQILLGLLGAFAEFELSVLRKRMYESYCQKAARGELYSACPPGYMVEGAGLVKTADRRVQRVLESLFARFAQCSSVGELCRWCVREHIELPLQRDRRGREAAQWTQATTAGLLRLLKNPTYAGTYVHGRRQTKKYLAEDGQDVLRRIVRLPVDQWPIVMQDHHPAYICWEQFMENLHRLQCNSPRSRRAQSGPILEGSALLSGLLRCLRCGHRLQVRYGTAGRISYYCRQGGKQRDGHSRGCFSFPGRIVEQLVSEQLLQVVRPAGIEAAIQAQSLLAAQRQQQRQLLEDRLKQCRYEADRGHRQYDAVDPENRLVAAELERRWNEKLLQANAAQEQLECFETRTPSALSDAQRAQLCELGGRLDALWRQSAAVKLKKQILRVLIQDIAVDLREKDQLVLTIRWTGDVHSQHTLSRCTRPKPAGGVNLPELLTKLRLVADDEGIAQMLNRIAIQTPRQETWTQKRVAAFRRRHSIAAHEPQEMSQLGLLTQAQAATRLAISPMSVHRLLKTGLLAAEQPHPGLPWLIPTQSLDSKLLQQAVKQIKSGKQAPLPDDPSQLSLWKST